MWYGDLQHSLSSAEAPPAAVRGQGRLACQGWPLRPPHPHAVSLPCVSTLCSVFALVAWMSEPVHQRLAFSLKVSTQDTRRECEQLTLSLSTRLWGHYWTHRAQSISVTPYPVTFLRFLQSTRLPHVLCAYSRHLHTTPFTRRWLVCIHCCNSHIVAWLVPAAAICQWATVDWWYTHPHRSCPYCDGNDAESIHRLTGGLRACTGLSVWWGLLYACTNMAM